MARQRLVSLGRVGHGRLGVEPEARAQHALETQRKGKARVHGGGDDGALIDFADYTLVPAWYVAELNVGVAAGDDDRDAVQLRPEMFLLSRVTWATASQGLARDPVVIAGTATDEQGNVTTYSFTIPAAALGCGCCTGDSLKVKWSDEFTKFTGLESAILSALMGSSGGFLDLRREILLAGKQTFQVELERIYTLQGVTADQEELVQIIFHGVGLLPRGTNQSGSL